MAGPFVQAVAASAKSIALQDLPESAWRSIVGSPLDDSVSPAEVFQRVPFIYRAVTLRAQTLADIPCAILKGTTEVWSSEDSEKKPPQNLTWLSDIFDLLYRTEMAMCIDARAFWLIKRNRVRILEMQWLQPSSVTPKFDQAEGLVGFERRIGNERIQLEPSDVFYTWMPSHTAELGPGISPVRAAINAAGLLKGIDDYGRGFFERGAINTTILSVEGNPSAEELARLEKWWKRLLSGVRRAFETVAVRANVKPVVVGSPPKDMALSELTDAKRLDISAALGVPLALLEDQSSNYATARESTWGFLVFTMLPEAEMIERAMNKQIFEPLGYEFRFKPDLLEVMREREDEKAYKLLASVVGGVVTPNEMRVQLGLPELPGLDELRTPPQMQATELAPHTNGKEQQTMIEKLPRGNIGPQGAVPTSNRQVTRELGRQLSPQHERGANVLAD
jgi:HK97 family phage portal protein